MSTGIWAQNKAIILLIGIHGAFYTIAVLWKPLSTILRPLLTSFEQGYGNKECREISRCGLLIIQLKVYQTFH